MERRKIMTSDEKVQSSAKRKGNYHRMKNTPSIESIAMPRPDVLARSDSAPSMTIPSYTVGTDEDMGAFISTIVDDDTISSAFMDNEYYLFGSQGSDDDSHDGDEVTNMSSAESVDIDPFDFVYSNLPDRTHILKHAKNCDHCKAKKFESETDGFCCRNGKIELKEPDPIPELMRLWSSMDADSRHFRENIRFFNGHFAFTTLGVNLDENYTNMKFGVYTFRAHGTIYHNVHSFGPSSRPEHLQLYFYDDDPNLTHRKAATKQLDQNVVKVLVDILRANPYSQQFRSLGAHKDHLDDYRIDLNTDQRLDQRRYNRPVSSEVAAIWVEGADLAKRFDRSITLFGNDNQRHSIGVTDGSYDPLSYPLFYPCGELGWHPKLPKRNVPWEVVQQPRRWHDNEEDAGSPFIYYVIMKII
ncbi:uncharacterized protein LOC123394940 isoform X2 [Hordeum vulgare subsp. vulgare]|uniref:uncharacterized protein LOC123394940 isoform X2 n=1 Tax=Hordeum vulgare subsp. vulgare TaxID=112509 RepID=UPI001D1A55BA|nr:uncharacterized protein LOC123394940 isoform X2 [Hordeum vulgare subsp. vulgare]